MFLIKRYTPPTCTLKIFSKTFSWQRWTGIIATEDLSFELDLDDPRLLEHQQLSLKGNYQQLQILSQTVKEYIEQILRSFPELNSKLTVQDLLRHRLNSDLTLTQPLELSSIQLFDLANALEQYQQDRESKLSVSSPVPLRIGLVTGLSLASLLVLAFSAIALKLTNQTEPTLTTNEVTTPPPADIIVLGAPSFDFTLPEPVLPEVPQHSPQLPPPEVVETPTTPTPPTSSQIPPLSQLPRLYSSRNPTPSPKLLSPREEVQTYFQQRWLPTENLTEKLEYRLIISKSGVLESIIPIGRAAQVYLDQIRPTPQEPITISTLKTKTNLKIRLILTPTGLVQTFNEDS
ncbi:DUF4335 domain-containing protein [Gloeocapsa sp. PCC 73106]|uniref:DUF4335 domain-containing protein n=1 Tax=Gloeocapsa sp. PCC 73106 TaxID=102232 RepID=UPI0002ABDFC1|nr:DUF4335 domain-containing protein [Gloeocapsa sp. PCC 73106]ELR96240.1 hypothetical protein GLO73106DRAFT_00000280 [Gloeocapsa sp. PCC 73106]